MNCDRCYGTGNIRRVVKVIEAPSPPGPRALYEPIPCPDCHGSGIAYCCDDAGASSK